jgi:hypothetical protein
MLRTAKEQTISDVITTICHRFAQAATRNCDELGEEKGEEISAEVN